LPEEGHGCGLIIDENASLATGGNLALYDDVSVFGLDPVFFQNFLQRFFPTSAVKNE